MENIFIISPRTGKRTLVVRLGMDLASKIHAAGTMFAYIFHIWLYYAGFISTLTFLLLLTPAPIGLQQVTLFSRVLSVCVKEMNSFC